MNKLLGDVCQGRNNNFDFIRFLAASGVIYSHAFPLASGNYFGEFLSNITNNRWSVGALKPCLKFKNISIKSEEKIKTATLKLQDAIEGYSDFSWGTFGIVLLVIITILEF